jgi:transglutaminase-like putative cysteine protease
MTSLAAGRLAAGAGAPPRDAAPRAAESAALELALRVAAFAALCLFASLHWARLVAPAPSGRAVGVALLATAGAAGIGAVSTGVVRTPRRTTGIVLALLVVATLAVTLMGAGLPARFLAPAHWGDLRDGIDRGVTGTSTISWPYAAADLWVRLSILLAMPAAATLAAALAFAPRGPRSRPAGRIAALVVLVGVYAFAVTEISLGSPVARGLALLVLIAAWLWLPRVRRADALTAAAVVLAAGVVAIPVARSLDGTDPWIHWQEWSWFSATGGERFEWDHQYGPITWPRTGRTLLDVRSARPHYWKAETLDRFDGVRWEHSGYYSDIDVNSSLPARLDPAWVEKVHVTLRGMQSNVLIAAGTLIDYNGPHAIATSGDGTVNIEDGTVGKGDSYDVHAYVPAPSAARMRAVAPDATSDMQSYVAFDLPAPTLRQTPEVARLPLWSEAAPATDPSVGLVLASPYRRVYQLARSLAAGAPTTYDVVQRVEGYLEQARFTYNEQPPVRRYPLASFLLKDRQGYCQQFSGAMALMLRMDGIPARVATGFSPGIYDPTTKEFRVRDLDAHSWVEVWFRGIGWVPFDPTPAGAPASSRASGNSAPSAAVGNTQAKGGAGVSDKRDRQAAITPGGGAADASRSTFWVGVGVLAAVVVLTLAGLWIALAVRSRRVRRRHDAPAVAELAAALELLGYRVAPGTTLLQLERRLGVVADERAARYVRLLRAGRFSAGSADGPSGRDRRELRASLTARRGPLGRMRGYLALPPHLHGA